MLGAEAQEGEEEVQGQRQGAREEGEDHAGGRDRECRDWGGPGGPGSPQAEDHHVSYPFSPSQVFIFHYRSGATAKKDSRKRDRSASSAKLDKFDVPAAKMARATGSDRTVEAKFLEESFKKREKRWDKSEGVNILILKK